MEEVIKTEELNPGYGHEDLGPGARGMASGSGQMDKGLVAMFLKLSPEERLRTNDNAARTILELRNAYQRQKIKRR